MQTTDQEAAFQAILTNEPQLRSIVASIVHDRELAKDTYSDAVLEIVASWDSFDSTKEFIPWASTIIRRIASEHFRRRNLEPLLLDEDIIDGAIEDIDDALSHRPWADYGEDLTFCLARLSDRQKQIIQLRFYEDLPYRTIALSADRNANSLQVIIHRLLALLLRCIQQDT